MAVAFSSCKGTGDAGSNISPLEKLGTSQSNGSISNVETQKLVSEIKANPAYRIEASEIDLLKAEGLITDQEVAQFKAIQ